MESMHFTTDESAEYREILISAVDKSWTDVKRRLNGTDGEIEATKPQKRKNLYYVVDDVAGELNSALCSLMRVK